MKPQFENVTIPKGCSIRVFHRQIPEIPFEWHLHPECELTLTLNSRGFRFIADHVAAYDSHDLVLVPPEMPHTWASSKAINEASPHVAVVIWFMQPWALQVAELCPEYSSLRKLLKRSASGLSFPASAGKIVESRLPDITSHSSQIRLRTVLGLLTELAELDASPLATPQKGAPMTPHDAIQLNRILDVLHKRFAEPLRIEDLCLAGNLSERSLHRLFVRHFGENPSDYLGRLRIGRACLWLVETDRPISVIAADAGFSNLSNFNRRFRAARQMTPRAFRNSYLEHGRIPELDAYDLNKRSPSLEPARR